VFCSIEVYPYQAVEDLAEGWGLVEVIVVKGLSAVAGCGHGFDRREDLSVLAPL
jgi:hypothetical protein